MRIKLINIFTISVSNKRVKGVHFSIFHADSWNKGARNTYWDYFYNTKLVVFEKKNSETNCTKEEIFNYNKQHAVGIANLLRNYNQRMINYMIWYITQRYGVKLKGLGLSMSCVLFCKAKLGTLGLQLLIYSRPIGNALSHFQCENLENFLQSSAKKFHNWNSVLWSSAIARSNQGTSRTADTNKRKKFKRWISA